MVSSKKRKVTGTRRISFESSYARISGWAEHILSRLEDGVAGLELVDQQFLHEETEAEVKGQQEQVEELVSLGEQLIKGKLIRKWHYQTTNNTKYSLECSSCQLIS